MTVRILIGDVREQLATLPDDSVDCVVTSPPYWGLRDYGTATWEGGDTACPHKPADTPLARGLATSTLQGGKKSTGHAQEGFGASCPRCGAVRIDMQIGMEPTLGEHITVLVEVFREVRRVMKPTATLWLNYGDCYATAPNGRSAAATKAAGNDDRTFRDKPFSTVGGVLKPKDLCLAPFRLAIALQEDGWWVRSRCMWGKPNGMPDSSGRYRPSVAHEEIFMLTKTGSAYYDSEAVKAPPAESSIARWNQNVEDQEGSSRANAGGKTNGTMKAVGGPRAKDKQRGHSRRHAGFNDRWDAMSKAEQQENGRFLRTYEPEVWHIATAAYSDAHFATFPPALVERCLTASTRPGDVVLDPFGGAGTTGLVADRMNRDAILIELNPEYAALAEQRIETDAPLFTKVSA